MTRNEARELLGENATEAQITALLDKVHLEQTQLKSEITDLTGQVDSLTKTNQALDDYKAKWEEAEKAKLSEAEKTELEKKELQEKLKKANLHNNSLEIKSILITAGIDAADADELVQTMVREDIESSKKAANLYVSKLTKITEATTKRAKEELMNMDVTPPSSNIPTGSEVMTKEKFFELSPKEREKFVNEHREEFLKL